MNQPDVKAFHDEATFTVTYVVSDPATQRAAIIDPVHDFDAASGRISSVSSDAVIDYVRASGLNVDWILETHVHADHLSGAPYLQEQLGGRTAIGAKVSAVQETFKHVFNLKDLATDGSQFDQLFADGDTFNVGEIAGRVITTPGQTSARREPTFPAAAPRISTIRSAGFSPCPTKRICSCAMTTRRRGGMISRGKRA
jgi:glyoxylase-like metal-dependent hydrolase (beta-lactamase superfamily II)